MVQGPSLDCNYHAWYSNGQELFGSYTSPFVRHCRIALLQSKLPWTFMETQFSEQTPLSPTMKVPYFRSAECTLTDSSSILRFVREQAKQTFLPEVAAYDLYCTTTTALDAGINIVLMERMDGLSVTTSSYLARQQARLDATLVVLEARDLPTTFDLHDEYIRLACFLGWGIYRKRFDLVAYPQLQAFHRAAATHDAFAQTCPP